MAFFQPPYSPEFNSCEFCFHDIKEFLRRNQRLAEEHTEYAIYEACTGNNCYHSTAAATNNIMQRLFFTLSHVCLLSEIVCKYTPAIQSAE